MIVYNNPVSSAEVMTIFCSCRNLGWAASGAKPRIILSDVDKYAPASLSASKAYFLSTNDRDEQQSTTTWTSRVFKKIM